MIIAGGNRSPSGQRVRSIRPSGRLINQKHDQRVVVQRLGRPTGAAVVLLFLWTAAVSAVAILRVWGLGAKTDLGFTLHALAAAARDGLNAPASWAGWTLLEDHFSPWLLLMAPVANSRWGGYALVVAQAIAYGTSIYFAWRFLARSHLSLTDRRLLLAAFALAPALTFSLFWDFHANVLAVPFMILLLDGLVFDRPGQALVAAIGASGFREDVAILVLVLAVVFGRRRPWAYLRLGVPAALCLSFWRLAAGEATVGYGTFYGYIADAATTGGVLRVAVRVLETIWADGFLLVLAISVLFPWLLLSGVGLRPLVALAAAGFPYLAADSLIAKSVGFHYWVLAPALMLASVIDHTPTEGSQSRRFAFGVFLVFIVFAGPFGYGTLGPGGQTVSAIVRGSADRARTIELVHEGLACIGSEDTVSLMPEALALTGHLKSVHLLPHPFAPIVWQSGEVRTRFDVINPNWPDWVVGSELPAAAQSQYSHVDGNPMVWSRQPDAHLC